MRVLGLALIMLNAAQAQPLSDLFGTETFHRAYFEGNEIRFDPFQQLNWEALARTAFPRLNFDRATSAQIARLEATESAGAAFRSASFSSALDPMVARVPYLLIYDAGAIPIQPVQL